MIQWGDGKTIEDPVFRCHLSCHCTGQRQAGHRRGRCRPRAASGLSGATGRRSGWSLHAFVLLTNHLHLVLKTPRPNLAKGMQLFLSSYANGWARRHRHGGHLFQGRYRTELVEDETYLWVLTIYVHLNPVRAGLAATPQAWIWSSCPGYFRRRDRLDWVAYDALLAVWAGEFERTDPEASYRRFVTAGLTTPPVPPSAEARHGMAGSSAVSDSWIACASVSAIRPIATCAGSGACFAGWISPG